jgi:hypothetical protein
MQADQALGVVHDAFVMGGKNKSDVMLVVHMAQQLHELLGIV